MRAMLALVALVAIAAALMLSAEPGSRPDRGERPRPSSTPAQSARTPLPSRLERAAINRQDRVSRRHRAREGRVFDLRPLLTRLPLERAGVRIDIGGLAADDHTTVLAIDPGARSRARAIGLPPGAASLRRPGRELRSGLGTMSARALTASYALIWLATITGAALARAGAELQIVDAPHRALDPTLQTAGELFAHNCLVALWPLALVVVGWPCIAGAHMVADALIAAQLVVHGLLVGSALGQHPELWRYLPHLPVEWLAIAIPAAAWLTARSSRPERPASTPARVVGIATAALAALAGAAAIETYLIPVS